MDERDTRDPLKDLEERLDKARRGQIRPASGSPSGSRADDSRGALGLAFRIGVELVVAVAIGVGVGWALDNWLGTKPWGMIVFLFLGIGAGMLNVYRTVMGMGLAMGYKAAKPPPAEKRGGSGWADEDED